jgi:tetratricopeptide (TPR) repeat protein
MKPITVFVANELQEAVVACIQKENSLQQFVSVHKLSENQPQPSAFHIRVEKNISFPIDWFNQLPPVLFPNNISFSCEHFLAILFSRLGNYDKAKTYYTSSETWHYCIDMLLELQQNIPISSTAFTNVSNTNDFAYYTFLHNKAIALHYGAMAQQVPAEEIQTAYWQAIEAAVNEEYRAFSIKHYATFLTEVNQLQEAEHIIREALNKAISSYAQRELKALLISVLIQYATVFFEPNTVNEIKELLQEVLPYYQASKRDIEEAQLLSQLSYLMLSNNNFSEALSYINKAINLLQQEMAVEMLAAAQLQKATLLFHWAQSAQPQFYRNAMKAYQEALKVFTAENYPDVFADIQHHLGIIYSEIPDDVKKKNVWAGISVASFLEALNFYNKVDYPYQFGMICNNFGNAYTQYPPAIRSDNFEKALAWYREALDVRTAEQYPEERAATLLNYVEACWHVAHVESQEKLYAEMMQKLNEVKTLTTNADLLNKAQEHLLQLQQLKSLETDKEVV